MKKRGEMTSAQITALIVLIAGFIIILVAVFFIIDIDNYSQDEVCRLSVLTRATAPDAAQRALPLKCTTGKICLSQNGESCQAFIGEDDVMNIALPSDNVRAARIIEETTANELYDCWSLMGQGKLNLFEGGKDTYEIIKSDLNLNFKESTCVLCGRVALSPTVLANEDLLNLTDVNEYVAKNKVPGNSRTYLEVFTDSLMSSYPREFSGHFSGENKTSSRKTDEVGIIFMQIKTPKGVSETFFETTTKTGTFLIGGSAATIGLKTLNPYVLLGAGIASAGTGGIAAFQTWQSRQVSAGYCNEFTTKENSFNGCSIVTGFDYHDISNLRNFCGRVEGTP